MDEEDNRAPMHRQGRHRSAGLRFRRETVHLSAAMDRAPPRSKLPAGPLRDLVHISRAVGADPDLVQGGGGNTSVKTRDGRRMFVKASGTALAAMDAGRGWAELDLE